MQDPTHRAQSASPVPPAAAPPLIRVHNVVKRFGAGLAGEMALDGVSLAISAGEFVAVIGKSGSGKSTLINLLTGIDRPTAGQVLVGLTRVHELGEEAGAVWRGRHVGLVFQFFQLLPTLSVLENVMLPMDFVGLLPERERRLRAAGLLEVVGVAGHAGKLPSSLSGGQQQRVALARALANDPPLLVADEPTGNLDTHTAAEVLALFAALARAGKTVVIVTHEREVATFVDRVITLRDGRVESEARGGRRRGDAGGGS